MRVFNNGNTVVEVSVKTRKNPTDGVSAAKNGGAPNWDSLLSQDEPARAAATSRLPSQASPATSRKKKLSSYAQPTRSSKSKSLHHTKKTPRVARQGGKPRELQRYERPA